MLCILPWIHYGMSPIAIIGDNFTSLGKYIQVSSWKSSINVKYLHYDVNGGISLSSYWWMKLQKAEEFLIYSAYLFFQHQTVFQVFLGIWNFRVDFADSSLCRLWRGLCQSIQWVNCLSKLSVWNVARCQITFLGLFASGITDW